MSAPVDVLAAMDKNIYADELAGANPEFIAEMCAARAAVAELIEADKEYDAALSEFSNGPRPDLSPDSLDEWTDEWMKVAQRADLHERLQSAKARRAAALARVGGAS